MTPQIGAPSICGLPRRSVARWREALSALPLFVLLACEVPKPPEPPPQPPPPATHCQLLLFPEENAASLLGRALQRSADGTLTIADSRAPGCDVEVQSEAAVFHESRAVNAHSMTSFAGGYAKLVSIDAKFGRESNFQVDVDNTAILSGNVSAACGERVVDRVFVGRGHRRVAASSQAGGSGEVAIGVVQVAPKVDTGQSQEDAVEWSKDEAYGFTFHESAGARSDPLRVEVSIPSIIAEGDEVEVQFHAARPAWLVVYYIDSTGHGDVLWPSNEEPDPYVAPGQAAVMPSEREKAKGFHFKAALPKPGEPSRETLVVYGFADKRDFDVRKPSAGAENADGPSYAAALTKELQNIPMDRWSRTVAGYVIQPKQ